MPKQSPETRNKIDEAIRRVYDPTPDEMLEDTLERAYRSETVEDKLDIIIKILSSIDKTLKELKA